MSDVESVLSHNGVGSVSDDSMLSVAGLDACSDGGADANQSGAEMSADESLQLHDGGLDARYVSV